MNFGPHDSHASLADEYYTSPHVYDTSSPLRPEPWEPNVTALHDPRNIEWGDRVSPDTPVPTPWPKEEFEAFQKKNQANRNYRPSMNCMMFTRSDFFCDVCASAIEDVIRLSVGE